MVKKNFAVMFFSLYICLLIFSIPLNAEQPKLGEDLFIAPLTEVNGYGWASAAFGGGVSIGAGTGGAIGLNLLYAVDVENFVFVEVLFFLRTYIIGKDAALGPFVQFGVGPILYSDAKPEISGHSNFSMGLSAGWRIPTSRYFYIEPSLRVGYPYLLGASFSFGIGNRDSALKAGFLKAGSKDNENGIIKQGLENE
jgi:hypothetical protein